jgi:hypothetical protein
MVSGERHRVARGLKIDFVVTASIDSGRGDGPAGVAVLAARSATGVLIR